MTECVDSRMDVSWVCCDGVSGASIGSGDVFDSYRIRGGSR